MEISSELNISRLGYGDAYNGLATIPLKGHWSPGQSYSMGDITYYIDGFYVSKAFHVSSEGYSPYNAYGSVWIPFLSSKTKSCSLCMTCSKMSKTACFPKQGMNPNGGQNSSQQPSHQPSQQQPSGVKLSESPFQSMSPFPKIQEKHIEGVYDNTVFFYCSLGSGITSINDPNVKEITSNNPKCYIVSGKNITCIKEGSACIKITFNDGSYRLIGFYNNSFDLDFEYGRRMLFGCDYSSPISQENFWADFKNQPKKCDIFTTELSVNWTNENYKQSYEFIRFVQRLGGYPCFVYKQFSENSLANKFFCNSADYIKKYFENFSKLLDNINCESPSNKIYIIMEPLLISGLEINVNLSKVNELNLLELMGAPLTNNNLSSFISSINLLTRRKCPQVYLSWVINVSSNSVDTNYYKNLNVIENNRYVCFTKNPSVDFNSFVNTVGNVCSVLMCKSIVYLPQTSTGFNKQFTLGAVETDPYTGNPFLDTTNNDPSIFYLFNELSSGKSVFIDNVLSKGISMVIFGKDFYSDNYPISKIQKYISMK